MIQNKSQKKLPTKIFISERDRIINDLTETYTKIVSDAGASLDTNHMPIEYSGGLNIPYSRPALIKYKDALHDDLKIDLLCNVSKGHIITIKSETGNKSSIYKGHIYIQFNKALNTVRYQFEEIVHVKDSKESRFILSNAFSKIDKLMDYIKESKFILNNELKESILHKLKD